MNQYSIGVVVGSLRRDSINRKLAKGLVRLGPPEFGFRFLEIGDLPLYNQDDDERQAEQVKRLKNEVNSVQGLIFVTPEYNRSIPGVLKNALDNASRPRIENAWAGKPAGVMGASFGGIGTAMAQQHLRNVLAFLDVPVMGQPEAFVQIKEGFFEDNGDVGPGSKGFLQGWMDRYVAWVKKFAG